MKSCGQEEPTHAHRASLECPSKVCKHGSKNLHTATLLFTLNPTDGLMDNTQQPVLTSRLNFACPLGLVPDGHAVILQLEVTLLLPALGLDFAHQRPLLHLLQRVCELDAWG